MNMIHRSANTTGNFIEQIQPRQPAMTITATARYHRHDAIPHPHAHPRRHITYPLFTIVLASMLSVVIGALSVTQAGINIQLALWIGNPIRAGFIANCIGSLCAIPAFIFCTNPTTMTTTTTTDNHCSADTDTDTDADRHTVAAVSSDVSRNANASTNLSNMSISMIMSDSHRNTHTRKTTTVATVDADADADSNAGEVDSSTSHIHVQSSVDDTDTSTATATATPSTRIAWQVRHLYRNLQQNRRNYAVFLNGCCGVYFITSVVYISPLIGFSLFFISAVMGQILTAMLLDHFGLLWTHKKYLSCVNKAGAVFAIIGVVVFQIPAFMDTADTDKNGNTSQYKWIHILYILLSIVAGCVLTLQACLNRRLRCIMRGSAYQSAFISFLNGTIVLLVMSLITYAIMDDWFLVNAAQLRWYIFFGGCLGLLVVTLLIICPTYIGFTATFIGVVCGNLITSFIFDWFGTFSSSTTASSSKTLGFSELFKIGGAVLVIIGSVLANKTSDNNTNTNQNGRSLKERQTPLSSQMSLAADASASIRAMRIYEEEDSDDDNSGDEEQDTVGDVSSDSHTDADADADEEGGTAAVAFTTAVDDQGQQTEMIHRVII